MVISVNEEDVVALIAFLEEEWRRVPEIKENIHFRQIVKALHYDEKAIRGIADHLNWVSSNALPERAVLHWVGQHYIK
jgi:hypothetical protein